MKREEIELFENIQQIDKNQGVLFTECRSAQQQLFQLRAHRKLLASNTLHKKVELALSFLPGTFCQNALEIQHLAVCLKMHVELNSEEHPLLKQLIEWSENFPQLREQKEIQLMEAVLPEGHKGAFTSYEKYLGYIGFVGADLAKLIRRGKTVDEFLQDQRLLHQIDADDLLDFLLNSLPKVLYNLILPNDVLPPEYRKQYKSLQILYKTPSNEYFVRSKAAYATLMKILLKILVKLQLKSGQQKKMMEVVFRYFYAYHHDKKYAATDIFIEAFNGLAESVRYAISDELVMFFKIIKKVGKGKFVDYLLSKSQWMKEIWAKVADNNYVGYNKQSLNPFPTLRMLDTITVGNGKSQYRTFQILHDYSLFYFYIDVPSRDLTIRLHYLGDFTARKDGQKQLLTYQKKSGITQGNIMAIKRGLYTFQFDNTYSWIYSKTAHFEYIVLAPVQFQSENTPKWINAFYDNTPTNTCPDKSKVFKIRKGVGKDIEYDGVANITKEGGFYNLKMGQGDNMYEFQTENQDKLVQKFSQIVEQGKNIKWMIGGQALDETDDLKKLLTTTKEIKSPKKWEKPTRKIQKYTQDETQKQTETESKSNKQSATVPAQSEKAEVEQRETEGGQNLESSQKLTSPKKKKSEEKQQEEKE